MELILTQDVDTLGQAGDVVRVRPGYGRNFLLPRGMAILATRGNMAQVEHHRRAIARERERVLAEQRKVAESLRDATVSIARKSGKDGKLFGSVTAKDIADALAQQNVALDRRLIHLDEPLRVAGPHEVVVKFSGEVHATLRVNVIAI